MVEGFGKLFWSDGDTYIGYWKQDYRDGFGKYFYSDEYYEGEFKQN